MKRMVVEAAVCLLLVGLAMAWLNPPRACGCIRPRSAADFDVSFFVRTPGGSGWSVGLVTVTAGGGEVRTNPTTGDVETSIRVAATSWVGTVPTRLWVDEDDDLSSSGLPLAAFRPGTHWVVKVKNADAGIRNYPLPVVGDTVRLPWKQLVGEVDGPKREVVNLEMLRGIAQRQQS